LRKLASVGFWRGASFDLWRFQAAHDAAGCLFGFVDLREGARRLSFSGSRVNAGDEWADKEIEEFAGEFSADESAMDSSPEGDRFAKRFAHERKLCDQLKREE